MHDCDEFGSSPGVQEPSGVYEELEEIKDELHDLKIELKETQDEAKESRTEINELEKQCSDYEKELETLTTQLDSVDERHAEECEEYKKSVVFLEQTLSTLRHKYVKALSMAETLEAGNIQYFRMKEGKDHITVGTSRIES